MFGGGWTIEAAAAVCSGDLPIDVEDGLSSLLDKSLVRQDDGQPGEPRFTLLETIRDYALERLAAHGEEHSVRRP